MPLVRSRGWWPCRSTLKCVPWCLAFPSIPSLDALPSPTLIMEETSLPHRGSSMSMVRLALLGTDQKNIWFYCTFKNRFVIVATGGIDPWKELSVVQSRTEDGEEAESIFIEDTAHCADMMSERVTDRRSLRKAKQVLYMSRLHHYVICNITDEPCAPEQWWKKCGDCLIKIYISLKHHVQTYIHMYAHPAAHFSWLHSKHI